MKKQQPSKKLFKKAVLFTFYFVLSTFFFLTGCEGDDEPVPAYLTINAFELQATDPNIHGSISHKITHAAVFLVDKNSTVASHQIGTVTLPATVPVIVNGDFELNIDPVVKANGSSLSLEVYPFYTRYTKDITLVPNTDVVVSPTTEYLATTNFRFIEGFESSGHLFSADRDNNPATSLEISNIDVFEGGTSGMVQLDTANNVFVTANSQPYDILFPEAGRAFMEVNYKTDVPLEFGVIYVDQLNDETANFEFVVLPKNEWNKIYFDMTNTLNDSPNARFVFAIRGGIPIEGNEFTMDEATVFLDNIKILTF